jgi:hypothetical protein
MPRTEYCDRCGQPIAQGALRFVVRLQVFAAADTLEVTAAELLDHPQERIEELLRQCEGLTEEQLMEDVYVEREYDLCPACKRRFMEHPLGGSTPEN